MGRRALPASHEGPGDMPGWTGLVPSETAGPDETLALGRRLAAPLADRVQARGQTVVALHGGLGAGKTHLVKGICAGLGIHPDRVTSPTFTLVHEYPGGRLPVAHVDAFRLEGPEEGLAIGVEDLLLDGLVLVEWPDRLTLLLPADALHLEIAVLDASRRHIGWHDSDRTPDDPPTR